MRYDIVMVTYNSRRWLRNCVAALAALQYDLQQLHLIFADNASTDGTVAELEALRREYPVFGGFTVYSTGKNAGFGAGCNAGARQGSAPFVFFMNVDTEICPDALTRMDAGIALNPQAGAWEMRQLPKEAIKWYDPVTLETNWCGGAAVVIPRQLMERVGGFDETIFMYCEDVDLSWRIRAAGYKLYYVPQATIRHYETQTYEGKNTFSNRNILLNNYYLRLKFGTKKDIAAFWQMYHHLQHQPQWEKCLQGTSPLLQQKSCASRVKSSAHFAPHFNQLSYDPVLFFAEEESGRIPSAAPLPLISILVHTDGSSANLRQLLQTIANQTVKNGYEIVVVEEGNAETRRVLSEFPDLPLRCHWLGQPVGRSAAYNAAARLAQGQYLCLVDESNWLLVNYLEIWQRLLALYPDAPLYFAGSILLSGSMDTTGNWRTADSKACPVDRLDPLVVAAGSELPLSAGLLSRELYLSCGGLDEKLDALAGWALWQRCVALCKPFVWNGCTSLCRQSSDVVEAARCKLAETNEAAVLIDRGRGVPVKTTMGELTEHFWPCNEQEIAQLASAQAYRDTAREIVDSTAWRVTKPLRCLGRLLVRWGCALTGVQYQPIEDEPDKLSSVAEHIEFIAAARRSLGWRMMAGLRRR